MKLLRKLRHGQWDDWVILLYYFGAMVTGAFGFLGPGPSPGVVHIFGDDGAEWLFSAQLLTFGLMGFATRLFRIRNVEFWAILGLSVSTVIHGLSVWSAGSEQTGLRLLYQPILMVVYGYYRSYGADAYMRRVIKELKRIKEDKR